MKEKDTDKKAVNEYVVDLINVVMEVYRWAFDVYRTYKHCDVHQQTNRTQEPSFKYLLHSTEYLRIRSRMRFLSSKRRTVVVLYL